MCWPTSWRSVSAAATARGAPLARSRPGAPRDGDRCRHEHAGSRQACDSSPDHTCYTMRAARARPHPARRRPRSRPRPGHRGHSAAPRPAGRCLSVVVPLDRSGAVPGAVRIRAARHRVSARQPPAADRPHGRARPGRRDLRRRASTSSCRPPAATSCCSTSAAPARPACCAAQASSARRPASPSRRRAAAAARQSALVLHERRLRR